MSSSAAQRFLQDAAVKSADPVHREIIWHRNATEAAATKSSERLMFRA